MAKIEEHAGELKVTWSPVVDGARRQQSRWCDSRKEAEKLCAVVTNNGDKLPGPLALDALSLIRHAEPVDPKLVSLLWDGLTNENLSAEEKLTFLKRTLARFERSFVAS